MECRTTTRLSNVPDPFVNLRIVLNQQILDKASSDVHDVTAKVRKLTAPSLPANAFRTYRSQPWAKKTHQMSTISNFYCKYVCKNKQFFLQKQSNDTEIYIEDRKTGEAFKLLTIISMMWKSTHVLMENNKATYWCMENNAYWYGYSTLYDGNYQIKSSTANMNHKTYRHQPQMTQVNKNPV